MKAFDPRESRPDSPRVAIIGAGMAGINTALHLANHGIRNVVVLESGHPAEGSSSRSAGMVETQLIDDTDIAARAYGRRVVESLAADHGLTWITSGYLRLAHTSDDLEDFERSIESQRKYGVDDAFILTAEEMSARWPNLITADRFGGLFGAGDGFIDGHEYCNLVAQLVRSCGMDIRTNAPVQSAEQNGSGLWTLQTPKGPVEADIVVNAAGPWAGEVGDLLGAPVPLVPQLHGAVVIHPNSDMGPLPFVMDMSMRHPEDGLYFRFDSPERDTLFAGFHDERGNDEIGDDEIGDVEPVSPNAPLGNLHQAEIDLIVERLPERLSGLDEASTGRSWTGFFPVTPDYQPIAGLHPTNETVVCALGGGGSGMQLGPPIGLLAAAAISGETVDVVGIESAWAPGRFA